MLLDGRRSFRRCLLLSQFQNHVDWAADGRNVLAQSLVQASYGTRWARLLSAAGSAAGSDIGRLIAIYILAELVLPSSTTRRHSVT